MIKLFKPKSLDNQAYILASLLITTTFVLTIGILVSRVVIFGFLQASAESYRISAQFAADSGIDRGIVELNDDETWAGIGQETLLDNGTYCTTYEIDVDNIDPRAITLTVTGRTFAPTCTSDLKASRKYDVDLRGVSGGDFSVVTGVGGLILSNNAKIVGGSVFVNGNITLNNSSQIGLAGNPINIKAAQQSCPSPANGTYPRLCNLGENGEPINLSVNARIYGTVEANNQDTGTNMSSPGLSSNIDIIDYNSPPAGYIAPVALPPHDRAAQIAAVNPAATHTRSGASASCDTNGGAETWRANSKFTGNVTISKSCTVTIEGNVWITGNLSTTNSGTINTADALGTTIPNVMIDGSGGFSLRNSSRINGNTVNTAPMFVTYYSGYACSVATAGFCNVTGSSLFTSRNLETITMDQNVSGPQVIFFAKWSKIAINNSGDIGSLVGQTIELRNSGAISFGSSVPGFSDPPTWLVNGYRRR